MNTSSHSSRQLLGRALLSLTLLGATSVAQAQHRPEPGPRMAAMHEEPMRAPLGYTRLQRPQEIERERPHFGDQYRHNFRADRALCIGPYHPPIGYQYRRWHYGEILPRPFWGNDYLLSDFWLFDLDFPPAGYEWVRYGPDALLIDIGSGEVVQAVYGRFL